MIFSLEYVRKKIDRNPVNVSLFYDVIAEHIKESAKRPGYLHIRDLSPTEFSTNSTLINFILEHSPKLPADDRILFAKLFSKYSLQVEIDVVVDIDDWGDYVYEKSSQVIEPNDYEALNKFFTDTLYKFTEDGSDLNIDDDYEDCFCNYFGGFFVADKENLHVKKTLYTLNSSFLSHILYEVYSESTEITEESMSYKSLFLESYNIHNRLKTFEFFHVYNSVSKDPYALSAFSDLVKEIVLSSIDPELSVDVLDASNITSAQLDDDIDVTVHAISNINYMSIPAYSRSAFSNAFITHPNAIIPNDVQVNSYEYSSNSFEFDGDHDQGLVQTNILKPGFTDSIPVYALRNKPREEELYAVLVDITIGETSYTKVLCLSGLEIHKIPYIKYAQDKLTIDYLQDKLQLGDLLSTVDISTSSRDLAPADFAKSKESSEICLSYPLVCYAPVDFASLFKEDLVTYEEFKQTDLSKVLHGLIDNARAYVTASGLPSPPLNTFMYLKEYSANYDNPIKKWITLIRDNASMPSDNSVTTTLSRLEDSNSSIEEVNDSINRVYKVNRGHGVLIFTDKCNKETDTQIDIPYPLRDKNTDKMSVCPVNIKVYDDRIMVVSSDLLMSNFISEGTYASRPTNLSNVRSAATIRYLSNFDKMGISTQPKSALADEDNSVYIYNMQSDSKEINALDCIDESYSISTLNMLEYTFDIPFASARLAQNSLKIYEVPHFYMFLQIWNSLPHKSITNNESAKNMASTEARFKKLVPFLVYKRNTKHKLGLLYKKVSDSYEELANTTFLKQSKSTDVESHLADIEAQAKSAGITRVEYYTNVAVFETPPLYVKNTQIEVDDMYSFLGRYLIVIPINALTSRDLPTDYNIVPMDFKPYGNAALHTSSGGDQCMGNLTSLLVEATTYEDFFSLVIKSLKSYNIGDAWGVPVLKCYPLVHTSLLKKLLKHDVSCITDEHTSLEELFVPIKSLKLLTYDPYQIISYLDSNVESEKVTPEDVKNMLVKSIQDVSVDDSISDYSCIEDMFYRILNDVDHSIDNILQSILYSPNAAYNRVKREVHNERRNTLHDKVFDKAFYDLRHGLSSENEENLLTRPGLPVEEAIRKSMPYRMPEEQLATEVDKYLRMYYLLVNKVKLKIFSL